MTKTINGQTLELVEVPEGAYGFWMLERTELNPAVAWYDPGKEFDGMAYSAGKPLPPGNYTLLGLASNLSEHQWMGLVEHDLFCWFNYVDYMSALSNGKRSAKASGYSLLQSLSLKPENVVILIRDK